MYVIVEKAKLEGKFFGIMNTLPDGRVYIPISEMRNVGTLLDIDIIGSARELKELIEKQQEAMQGTEDIDPGFSVTPGEEEEIDPGFSQEPNPDSDSGASEEGDGRLTEKGKEADDEPESSDRFTGHRGGEQRNNCQRVCTRGQWSAYPGMDKGK